ncbi:hypothetical protein Cni_G00919 [Canna indica]|uniref:START domain-containing protein n=1 Tax=Canna indica TaxID=4628 RepID=A0AAQ3PXY2_9LILI|nr:hypothetical protein Cni_G00919 [Canna indica]
MEKKRKILELRERLDKTLADLASEESIKSMVKNQLCHSSLSQLEGDIEEIVGKRAKEVSNFIEMLRSASGNEQKPKAHGIPHNDWKIKQDTDQLRVMYREGPHGSPFHSLLAEGYADGPIDVCLCVSWETTLYSKWWPQYNVPTFKIIKSTCLQKVRVGEEISLVRVKVPWPISDREALLHYFEIEYLEEDLILVLINTLSDKELVQLSTDGYNRNGVPEVIRIDLVGGFVLQKVDDTRSYFRAIANMDIKLDFVPPSLINFISRQLIGNGHKLYQKAVGTVATTDKDYQQALKGPMYMKICEGMHLINKTKTDVSGVDEEKVNAPLTVLVEEHTGETATEIQAVKDDVFSSEIVEEEIEHATHLKSTQPNDSHATSLNTRQKDLIEEKAYISPEVQVALGILENAIAILRKRDPRNNQADDLPVDQGSSSSEGPKSPLTSISRHNMESSALENKVSVLSLETVDLNAYNGKPIESSITMTKPPFLESTNKVCDEGSLKANGFHEKGPHGGKSRNGRKKWLCCLSLPRD